MYQITFYVPESDFKKVTTAMFEAGAGHIGDYDSCCWYTLGTGQFRPLAGSNPHVGEQGKIEQVEELKVELVCDDGDVEAVIAALKLAHPYETPAYQAIKLN